MIKKILMKMIGTDDTNDNDSENDYETMEDIMEDRLELMELLHIM